MKITVQDTYGDGKFTLSMVGDWAIYARASDAMVSGMDEDTAIRLAVQEEEDDFNRNMERIRSGLLSNVDAVSVSDDDITIDDDFYTDEHMAVILKAFECAMKEAREDTYEEEVAYSWYHR